MKRYSLRNWLLATCKIDGIIEIGLKGTIYFFPSKLLPNGIHGDKNIVIRARDFFAGIKDEKLTDETIQRHIENILKEVAR